jgi:hypothetical protein
MPHATGDRLNASDLNLQAAKYVSLSQQACADSSFTKLVLATIRYNYGTAITINSPTFTELTLTRTGLYTIGGGVQMDATGSNANLSASRASFFFIGNSASTSAANRYALANHPHVWGGFPEFCVSAEHYFSAGDKISAYIWHNHGSARNTIVAGDIQPYMFARYLGDG